MAAKLVLELVHGPNWNDVGQCIVLADFSRVDLEALDLNKPLGDSQCFWSFASSAIRWQDTIYIDVFRFQPRL